MNGRSKNAVWCGLLLGAWLAQAACDSSTACKPIGAAGAGHDGGALGGNGVGGLAGSAGRGGGSAGSSMGGGGGRGGAGVSGQAGRGGTAGGAAGGTAGASGGAAGGAGGAGAGGRSGGQGPGGGAGIGAGGGEAGSGAAGAAGAAGSAEEGGRGGAAGQGDVGGQLGMGGLLGSAGQAGGAGVGGNGGGGGAPIVHPPSTVTLTDFADYQVIQRVLGGSSQTVAVRGSFTGSAVASIEAQIVAFNQNSSVVVPWTALGMSSDTGTYGGNLVIPQGGWYRVMVRALYADNAEGARATGTHRFGVGMNVLCIGQSNMVGYGGATTTTAVDLTGLYSNDRVWKHLADPYDNGGDPSDVDYDGGSGASMIPSLANTLAGFFPGVPIGIVPAAKGSSPLDCAVGAPFCWGARNASNPADPTTLYGNSITKARQAGGVELIVMHQGETDATNAVSGPQYGSDLQTLAQSYRADLGNLPLFIFQLGRSTSSIAEKKRTDLTMQPIRVAQHDADGPPSLYLAGTAIDVAVDSTDHYTKAAQDTLGQRLDAAIAFHFHVPGAPAAYRGPEIMSVSYADAAKTSIDVHLRHRGGTDFTPATGIVGFLVLDNGVAVTPTSVSRKDAATISIVLAAPLSGPGKVRYLYGKLPFTPYPGTVHDNSPLGLPLEPTTVDLPLP